MRYLVTGATGDVGSRVVEQLVLQGESPKIFVRDAERARQRFGDRVHIATGDFSRPESLRAAFEGVDAVFLVTVGPEIPVHDERAANAANAAGVKRLVKLSTLDVGLGLAIGTWHERGEAAIRASGVDFAFLQPTGFMSNLLAWMHSIKKEGVVRSSTGNGRRAFIHSEDIAAVAVKALATDDYVGESLRITGPEAVTFSEVTEKIGRTIGKRLSFQAISDDEARQRYAATGALDVETEAHVELWRAIREGRLADVTDTVERVVGRKPITLDRWIEENAEAFCETVVA